MATDRMNNDMLVMSRLDDEIRRGRIRVYRNAVGEPYVHCKIENTLAAAHFPEIALPLFHKDVRGWLNHFTWRIFSVLLQKREVDRILEVLAGRSLGESSTELADADLLDLIESEPVVAVLYEFVQTKPKKSEWTMQTLWKELYSFAKMNSHLKRGRRQFPGGPNVLSRKLRKPQIGAVLNKLGITVKLIRSNGCKVELERPDDTEGQSSSQPSAANPHEHQAIRPVDGREVVLQRLRTKQSRPISKPEGETPS